MFPRSRRRLRAELAAVRAERDDLRRKLRTDPLTGLPNRSGLLDVAARTTHGTVGLLLLDLDRFKPVNDTHGHRVGDRVLRAVAHRLTQATDPTEVPVRLHGDEFAIWLGPCDPARATRRARDLTLALAAPYRIGGLVLTVPASIGAAASSAPVDVAGLLAHADRGMYQAKRRRAAATALPGPARPATPRVNRETA
ncbi:GGDEF domain-containing protein [Actinoalloteichus caeruleus]|uniref:Diguanylate cyclase (GGDEF) domain-containing protein n=1 Tax=Actinoalloteichus caeruleus DSM 43889 TaxID=1120930 RepID=A0ABT1JF21_ACTCY|nr:GGDEF domain-containing protein [Actinoalloteichus caeruleus]MCP2330736.1 diguanylate cyclase (GGDEF) domain-containing protein [Actinoalloteichus caeruleus DSM 43889]